jgi:hypothetical protein
MSARRLESVYSHRITGRYLKLSSFIGVKSDTRDWINGVAARYAQCTFFLAKQHPRTSAKKNGCVTRVGQRAADGRNNGHSGTRQAQTEAPANTPDRIDTSCITNDKRQQPTQTQTTKNGGANQTPRTPELEATPGTAKSAPVAAHPTNRLDIVRIRGVIHRIREPAGRVIAHN